MQPDKPYVNLLITDNDGTLGYKAEYMTDEENAVLYVALYGENGELLAVHINAAEAVFEGFKTGGRYKISAFLWDGGQTSLCEPCTKTTGSEPME